MNRDEVETRDDYFLTPEQEIDFIKHYHANNANKIKVIFADVDGVLNTFKSRSELGWKSISPYLVSNLQKIVDATGAKIVISSTWRILDSSETLRIILGNAGLVDPEKTVIDITGRNSPNGHERGHDIQAWLETHEVSNYVILDDDSDMLESQMPHFVRCCGECGVSEIKTEWAIGILNGNGNE